MHIFFATLGNLVSTPENISGVRLFFVVVYYSDTYFPFSFYEQPGSFKRHHTSFLPWLHKKKINIYQLWIMYHISFLIGDEI